MRKNQSAPITTTIIKNQNTKSVSFNDVNHEKPTLNNNEDLIIHLNRIKLNETRRDVFKKRVKNSFKTRFKHFDFCFYLLRVLIIVIMIQFIILYKLILLIYLFQNNLFH